MGIVIIGRNEGERLVACLRSLCGRGHPVVYVDSGSSDCSVSNARSLGAAVVELDMGTPFTAARARNAGVEQLLRQATGVEFVQFVDGDCEVVDGWLEVARDALAANPGWGVVCGRLRERYRDRSIYHRLADLEWDTPAGEAPHCGGIAMYRLGPWLEAGGFDPAVPAGEEPDLCLRLRRAGWTAHRLPAEMAWHDVAMTRFGQWWRRAVRSGSAYAQGAARPGTPRYGAREIRSALAWGLALPLAAIALAWPTRGLSLLPLLAYPLLAWRIAHAQRRRGRAPADAALYARMCVVAKFAQVQGFARYWWGRLRGKGPRIIEYKAPAP